MLKRDVQEQLKSLLSYQEDCLRESERAAAVAGRVYVSDTDETFKKDIKALKIAIKAVENYDYDERETMTVEVKAIPAPEGGAYYAELETGDRLVIRENKIEGIYNPEEKPSKSKESDYKKAFSALCRDVKCPECPARFFCGQRNNPLILARICEENIFEALTK